MTKPPVPPGAPPSDDPNAVATPTGTASGTPSTDDASPEAVVSDPASDPAQSQDSTALKEYEAYGALASLGSQIATIVAQPIRESGVVLVQDHAGVAALAAYREFRACVAMLRRLYDAVAPDQARSGERSIIAGVAAGGLLTSLTAAVTGGRALVDGVVSLIATLKSKRRISSRMLTVSDESLAAIVCGLLARQKAHKPTQEEGDVHASVRVFYPPLFPPEALDASGGHAEILDAVESLAQTQQRAATRVTQLSEETRAAAQAQLDRLNALTAVLEAGLVDRESSSTASDTDHKAETSGSAVSTKPGVAPATGAGTSIAQLLRGAARHRLLGESGHLLFVKVLRLGGIELEIERRVRRDVSEFSGMAVASFFLYRADGTLQNAGTERYLGAFRERTP
jgi:hypothetical protein